MDALRLSLAGTLILMLLGGFGGSVTAQDESEPMAFPTGAFVSVENPDMLLVLRADGTGLSHNLSPAWYHDFAYAVEGDVYIWVSADWDWEPHGQMAYAWDYDGERLAFKPMSADSEQWRNWVYTANTYVPVEDPRVVMVAAWDTTVGEPVYGKPAFVATAAAGPDAFNSLHDLINRVAAVPISEGQPITPDLLESPAE